MNPQTTRRVAPGWERVTDANGATQYLPAVQAQRRQLPALSEVLPPAPLAPADLVNVWQTPIEGMVEHTSAFDRAKGVVMRSLPMFGTVALLAIAGALVAYGVAGQVPSVLTFLVVLACLGGGLYLWESRTEYAHSRPGVERLRIERSADIELSRMENEIELRRMALESYLEIMERQYADNAE